MLPSRPSEPRPRDLIRILDHEGEPGTLHTRVKSIISEDRSEELWEVLDSWNRTRIITQVGPREWLEVEL